MSTLHEWITAAMAAIPMEAARDAMRSELGWLGALMATYYHNAVECGDLASSAMVLRIVEARADVVGGVRVEGRIKADQVNGLVFDALTEHCKIVPVVERIWHDRWPFPGPRPVHGATVACQGSVDTVT